MAGDSAAVSGAYIDGTLTVTYVYSKNPSPTPGKTDQPNNPKKSSSTKGRGTVPDMGDIGVAATSGVVSFGGGLLLLDLRRKMKSSHK